VRLPIAVASVTLPLTALRAVMRASGIAEPAREPLGAALSIAVAWVAYGRYVAWVERREPTELSLHGAARELAAGAAIGAVLFAVVAAALAAVGALRIGPGGAAAAVLPGALALAAASGFAEEVLIRGVVFRIVEEALGTWPALVLSAALFGAAHLGNPGATWWTAGAIAVEAGVLLAAAYLVTRRLWLAIGLHAAWNFTEAGVFGVAVSGHDVPGLLRSTPAGPELLSGGAFGAEASVVAVVVCTAAGCGLLALAARRRAFVPLPWARRAGVDATPA